MAQCVRFLLPLAVIAALVTAGCGGGGDLSVVQPARDEIRREFTPGEPARYQLPFSISRGFLPFAASIDGCPGWVTLLSDHGVLAGTAPVEEAGKTVFCTYRVTEADPGFRPQRSVSYGLRLTVGSIDGPSLPSVPPIDLTVGTNRSVALPQAEDGVAPYTYSFTCAGGQLPPGMSFAPSPPVFAGTPDGRFRDSCTYTVTDSADESFSRVVQVEVAGDGPSLPSVPPIDLTVGTNRSVALPQAEDGVAPYTYSFTCAGGQLPPGMSFAPSPPVFAGTPDGRFRDSCTYTVTDSADESFSRVVQVEVAGDGPSLPSVPPIDLTVGTNRSVALPQAEDGVAPYTYSFTCAGGQLPPGMSFAPSPPVFAGTPDGRFRDSCTYTVTDSADESFSRVVQVEVAGDGPSLPSVPPIDLTVGTNRSVALPQAEDGVAPYTYSFTCAGGQLPPGMSFAPSPPVFAGTPDGRFRDSCTYTVTDSADESFSRVVQVEVAGDGPSLPSVPPIDLTVGTNRSVALPQAEDGVAPYTYSFTCAGGQLPPGMSFAPSPPVFAGTPDGRFRDSCTYTVTDSADESFSRVVQVEVAGDGPSLPSVPPIDLTVGTNRSVALPQAEDGVAPYTYSFTCTGGQLPPGMSFAPSPPVFAGTPDGRFRDSCTYTVTDSADESFSRVVQVEVAGDGPSLPSVPPIDLTVGTNRSVALPQAEDGVAPYTYSFTCAGGQLPPGMSFAPSPPVFAGTPDGRFRDSCTYTVTDSADESFSRVVQVEVAGDGPSLPSVPPIDLTVGTNRSVALPQAEDGVAPYTYSFTCAGGQLPPGMSFAPSPPVFAGTPDGRFRDSCTYTVTDSADESFSRVVQVEVAGDGPSLPSVPPIDLTVGTNRSVALPQAEDGVAPYTYSFTCAGGQLPPGMSFAPSPPVFAGTPDGRFRDSCTYTVTDSADESVTV